MNTTLIRVLVVDDHPVVRDGLKLTLSVSPGLLWVGQAENGADGVECCASLQPDVVLMDLMMPKMDGVAATQIIHQGMPFLNGLDAARRVREHTPEIKFVFLTMQDDPNLAAAALELGAIAFVLKHSGKQDLLQAIDHVLHGRPYLTPKLRAEDWVAAKARAQQFSKELTPRQREVVQLFAEGRPMKEIAWHLGLSEKIVEFHKHHIMEAFNIKSNAELVLFELKHGLISINPEPAPHTRQTS